MDTEKLTEQFNDALEACEKAKEGAESIDAYDVCLNKAKGLRAAYGDDPDNRDKVDHFIKRMEAGRDAFVWKHTPHEKRGR